ncbi:MAG: pyridoxamine 5'-phosphate oxidase family protein [Bacillota bacterium]
MTRQEMFDLMNSHPAFHLATMEGDQPRVRALLLFKADESGIIFHSTVTKDIYQQVSQNPKVELCFNDFNKNIQLRVNGVLEIVDDNKLKDEIANHPSRGFLKSWRDRAIQDFYHSFVVFRLSKWEVSSSSSCNSIPRNLYLESK